ncbi:polysaccharide deacetylase [Bacillus swezeyi]|uniref:Polysaccharide deacetylase n=1 Tax=Bacillus swezeyi TaxID=1925020 RepID=A0A1R1RW14_9BACI|nr:polysaccharide deacetylase family protein [Bacillus swezeyi]MEC1261737.1 polysaccharide deacetylase [Bacillus swezeyi]MED1738396.1 polysaccharide deacetylase [Bacillus swezeyi]MED2926400.1 polysaccharide deacetylase [Bacillus swezeyi]MED2943870.1 polysaccharide deacetylase [Bacillus swezeyi]MED2966037.1 polysaccharide deacetylase [Bacillus swezeyi]
MRQVSKKTSPSVAYLLTKTACFVILCLILLYVWDLSQSSDTPDKKELTMSENSQMRHEGDSIPLKKATQGQLLDHLSTKQEIAKREQEKEKKKAAEEKKNEKTIYLTFDDGPSAVSQRLLQILSEHDVKATFFMLEPNMKVHRQAVLNMKQQGHALGLHGVTHDQKQFYKDANSPNLEMKQAQKTLKSITGVETHLIRTPYGSKPSLTDAQKNVLKKNGFTYWDWNIDSLDWKYRSQKFVPEVMNQLNTIEKRQSKQPIVILMHDIPSTVQSLPLLITNLKNMGYSFETLDESMTPVHE